VLVAAPAAGQVTRHPGKVHVASTAVDALTVAGTLQGGTTATNAAVLGGLFRNTSNGSSATMSVQIGNDTAANQLEFRAFSSTFTSANNVTSITSRGAGGLDLVQTGASADMRVYMNTSTLALTFDASGQVQHEDGSEAAPAIAARTDPDTGFYWLPANPNALWFTAGGENTMRMTRSGLELLSDAFGTGAFGGQTVYIGRNSSGAGAPGNLALEARNGAGYGNIWVDTTGVLRIGASPATETSGDTIGTVIGTQTSTRASKIIEAEITDTAAAMAVIRGTPVYRFTYRDGRYNGETFYGITTDDSPLFGMDRGKSFNPVTAFGATVLALRDLDARLRALEAR
jgi:hypothetical protein